MIIESDIPDYRILWFIVSIVLLICAIAEAVVITYAYYNADKVKCTWGWCTYTKERRTIEENSECYINSIKVNCSDIENDMLNYSDMFIPYYAEIE